MMETNIEEYGETTQVAVKSECSGDSEKLLFKVIESCNENQDDGSLGLDLALCLGSVFPKSSGICSTHW